MMQRMRLLGIRVLISSSPPTDGFPDVFGVDAYIGSATKTMKIKHFTDETMGEVQEWINKQVSENFSDRWPPKG